MKPDTTAYVAVMNEIKRRRRVVHALHSKEANLLYGATQIESMILQIRMILELVMLSTLAANRPLFEQQKQKFEKHWHPAKIMCDVAKLNPSFYPVPIQELPSSHPGVARDLLEIKSGFLKADQLVALHGRCGDLLHAKNPFGKSADYKLYERMVPEWLEQIRALLNCHQIRLLDQDTFHLVHMSEQPGDVVRVYTFQCEGPVGA